MPVPRMEIRVFDGQGYWQRSRFAKENQGNNSVEKI
jgi:hypothetical protein